MDTKKCKGCEIEFTYDSNIKSDKMKKFCTKECMKKYHNNIRRKTKHEWGSLKKQLLNNTQQTQIEYLKLLTTHYTSSQLKEKNISKRF